MKLKNKLWWNDIVAIVLDRHNEVKTSYFDFIDGLKQRNNGLRCCFDIDLIVYNYTPTHVDDLKLIPLDEFTCKRTIVGTHGTRINLESCFGLVKDDFITIDLNVVELEQNKYRMKGLLVTRTNPYFDIINQVANHFGFVDADNDRSFVLDESELSEIQLVPFKLSYVDNHFFVSDFEDEMPTSEFDAIVDSMFCSDFAL